MFTRFSTSFTSLASLPVSSRLTFVEFRVCEGSFRLNASSCELAMHVIVCAKKVGGSVDVARRRQTISVWRRH